MGGALEGIGGRAHSRGWADVLGGVLGGPACVSHVREARLGTLWAGYGHVSELDVSLRARPSCTVPSSELPSTVVDLLEAAYQTHAGSESPRLKLVCKQVTPPATGSGLDHQRKLRSYEAEAHFYRACSVRCNTASPAAPVPVPLLIECDAPHSFTFVLSDLRPRYPLAVPMLNATQLRTALSWLAAFHAAFWEAPEDMAGMWDTGSYWHLDTRRDELAAIGPEWADLRDSAERIDALLKGLRCDSSCSAAHMTLTHGDFKAPNLLFTEDSSSCAAYDFQYVGRSLGARDVAYLLARSAEAGVMDVAGEEAALLEHYHQQLVSCLRARGPSFGASYTIDVLTRHYELALLDFVRFRVGWGNRTAPEWSARRARELLERGIIHE